MVIILGDDEWQYVELLDEANARGKVGRLKRWLYGMRQAASAWEEDYARRLESEGFVRGVAAPTVFWNEGRRITLVVHGDDFTASGWRSEMTWLEKKMGEWYEIKTRGRLDGVAHGMQEMTILNREINWNGHTLTYQADPKHVQFVAK